MNLYRAWFTDELGEDCYMVAEFRSHIVMTHCKDILTKEAKLRGLRLDIRVLVVEQHEAELGQDMDEYDEREKKRIQALKDAGMVHKTNWELVTGWKKTGNWYTYKYDNNIPTTSGGKLNGIILL